jgi:hypothetical protein
MNRQRLLPALVLLLAGFAAQPAIAQSFELHPYAGGFFPGRWRGDSQFKREGVYGIKAAKMFADRWALEGNLGYINHYQFESNSSPKTRAVIWEAGPSVNLYSNLFQHVFPYVSLKAGGLTGVIGDLGTGADDNHANLAAPGAPPVILSSGDTFFQFSYGGGLKAWNLWGPVGLRAEVLGRTMPNFFGNSNTWLETTGGITFSWGD